MHIHHKRYSFLKSESTSRVEIFPLLWLSMSNFRLFTMKTAVKSRLVLYNIAWPEIDLVHGRLTFINIFKYSHFSKGIVKENLANSCFISDQVLWKGCTLFQFDIWICSGMNTCLINRHVEFGSVSKTEVGRFRILKFTSLRWSHDAP